MRRRRQRQQPAAVEQRQRQGQKGGTLTILTQAEQFNHLDPQRNYTGEDLAFSSAYFARTLTAYKISPDGTKSGELVR